MFGRIHLLIVFLVGIIDFQKHTQLKKLKSMSQKVCYLLISPEKFQIMHGNGCFNGASGSNTGKKVSAILLPNNGLSSESETQVDKTDGSSVVAGPWRSRLADSFHQKYEVLPGRKLCSISHYNKEGDFLFSELRELPNGSPMATATNTPKSSEKPKVTKETLLSWLKTLSRDTK